MNVNYLTKKKIPSLGVIMVFFQFLTIKTAKQKKIQLKIKDNAFSKIFLDMFT
jgi:hypothetical protein